MAKFNQIEKARYLRKEETETEKILWQELRNKKLGVKFRRQHPIDKFILDFYAPEIQLGIELDGLSHYANKEYDNNRTKYLAYKKIQIIRFWNSELRDNLEKVLNIISDTITAQLQLKNNKN